MHIHSTQANAIGNALAGAQDAETAMSLRRARELRDAAIRLKAASFEATSQLAGDLQTDPETTAQTVSMITAWAGSSASSQSNPSIQERSAADVQPGDASSQTQPTQQVQRTPPARPVSNPVSYWA